MIHQMGDLSQLDLLQSELLRVKDVTIMIEESELFELAHYEDVTKDLFLLSKTGYVLEIESIHRILTILNNYNGYTKYFTKGRKSKYSHVYNIGEIADYSDHPIKKILKVFDEEGNVRPNASPELVKIHKKIEGTKRESDRRFNELPVSYTHLTLPTNREV